MSAPTFPPVPNWKPSIEQSLDLIVDRFRYYSDGKLDLAFFKHGTCALFRPGRNEAELRAAALSSLRDVFHQHPDMNPREMDDGNMLIGYTGGVVASVVLREFADTHWAEIEARHLDALSTSEVLITPLGPNKFDDKGKRALFGRCFMFMDAQNPEIVRIVDAERR